MYLVSSIKTNVYGVSEDCRPIGLSCLTKLDEILAENGFLPQEFYVYPMDLPNRCVNQQICVQPPNPFFDKLPNHVSNTAVLA
ncbi:hypothetical protein J6590_019148 [Homalodisca vitripennis]|nr:hypothetical protein J6590_019148 [Homalodisca vitripennis]